MSLPIAWVLKNKPVLLVGGGEVAETRVRKLVPEGARVVVVAPKLTPYIAGLASENAVRWVKRAYRESDLGLEHWTFVLTAIDDHETSKQIAQACRSMHIPVNVADVIPLCDFYFGANFQQGPLKVMVSTGSGAPRLAKRVLNELSQHAAQFQYGAAIEKVAKVREILRQKLPGGDPKVIQTRMLLMKTMCDKLSFAELAALEERDMEPMIRGMILSTEACPAHPIGETQNAPDFVADPPEAGENSKSENSKSENSKSENSKGENNKSESSSESESESESDESESESDESDSSDSSESESSTDSSELPNHSKKRPLHAPKSRKKSKSNFSGTFSERTKTLKGMRLRAVECSADYLAPQVPSFPFEQ